MMDEIEVTMSPNQTSRLRNGHKVRVKPAMAGRGIILLVSPSTFNNATRSLSKNKGVQIQLSPEEIKMNRDATGEMEGRGIFKAIGKIAKREGIKIAKAGGRELAKQLPNIATAGLTSLAAATGQPELIPLAGFAGQKLGKFAGKELNKAIDDPSKYSSIKKARRQLAKGALDTLEEEASGFADRKISQGQKYASTRMRGRGHCCGDMDGMGLYAGGGMGGMGLYAGGRQGRGMDVTATSGSVGVGGSLLSMSHPALQSQAHSANFQFQHTLLPHMKGKGTYV